MTRNDVDIDILTRAAAIYAASPSHASCWEFPAPGTECPTTAVGRAWLDVYNGGRGSIDIAAFGRARDALDRAAGGNIVEYNAEHTTEEVLAIFAKTIQSLR